MDDVVPSARFGGEDAESLAVRLGLARTELYQRVPSTLDIAHALARDGAPHGTLVLADEQTQGRGRGGKSWASNAGAGLWTAFVLRPSDVASIAVLSLRTGMRLAAELDAIAGERVLVKWPNDLLLAAGKVAGILTEARWREGSPEWVALGVGINVEAPQLPQAAGLPHGTGRMEVLEACARAVLAAGAARGALTEEEIRNFDARHSALGKHVTRPRPGIVDSLATDGALLIRDGDTTHAVHAGSLRYAGE